MAFQPLQTASIHLHGKLLRGKLLQMPGIIFGFESLAGRIRRRDFGSKSAQTYWGLLQVGIALVGMSSLFSRASGTQEVSADQMILGMALIVASQVPSLENNPPTFQKDAVPWEGYHSFPHVSLKQSSC